MSTIYGTGGADYFVSFTNDSDIYVTFAGNDTILAGAGNDEIYAGNGNDNIDMGAGNDYVDAGDGDDVIFGGHIIGADNGADIVEGGRGNDTIFLSGYTTGTYDNGADTVIYRKGDGTDIIIESDYFSSQTVDKLVLPDLNPEDFEIYHAEGNNLPSPLFLWDDMSLTSGVALTVKATGDTIYIPFQFWVPTDGPTHNTQIEEIHFANGTVWDVATLLANTVMPNATATNGDDKVIGLTSADNLSGGDGNDLIYADYGNDVVNGGAGDDSLFGQMGNDDLAGGDGHDILNGGAGLDVLAGGTGQDTFVFRYGNERDYVTDFEIGIDTVAIHSQIANSFNDLMALAYQDGGSTVFEAGHDLLILTNTQLSSLTASDFAFI